MGGILHSVSFLSVHYQIAWLLEVIAFGAVNTYAMISGFVSVDSHFKISNILILWLQVLFYGILINTVFFFLLPGKAEIHPAGYRHSFRSPEKNTGILLLMQECFFLSPFINQMFRNLSEKQIKNFILFYSCRIFCGSDHFTDFYTAAGVFILGDGYRCFLAHTDVTFSVRASKN